MPKKDQQRSWNSHSGLTGTNSPMCLPFFIIEMPITMMITAMIILMMSATRIQGVDAGIAPQISPVKPVLRALPGKIAVMPCTATGEPTPSITWERDGTPIQMFGSRFSVNKESKALRVFRMVTDDSGNYTCIAKNRFGMDSVTVNLLVLVKPKAMITSPTNFTFMEGINQELVCRSSGLPRPTFEWQTNQHKRIRASSVYFDNVPTYSQMYARERQIDDEVYESVLVFEPVTSDDYGMFTCVASNDVGSTRACVDLDVRFPPKAASGVISPEHMTWWAGHEIELKCEVLGNELPEITWFLDGRPFDCKTSVGDSHGPQVTSICMVTSSRYGGAGNYSCYANNSLGSVIAHEFIVKEIFPPPPVNFRPISVQRYEVILSVEVPVKDDTPPSTYVEATYKLAAYKVDDNVGTIYESMADVNDQGEAIMTLPGVLQDREYVVSMRAKNMAGFGPETTMVISTEIPSPTPSQTSLYTRTPQIPFNDNKHASNDHHDSPNSNDDDNNNNNNNNVDDDDDALEGDFSVDSKEGHSKEGHSKEGHSMEVATAYKVLGGNSGVSIFNVAFTGSLSICFFTISCFHLILNVILYLNS